MTGRSGSTGSDAPDPPADPAESVPGYRDLRRIGHGGFGVVYRAVQESFERDVALKVLTVGPDEDARRRFLREVRLAARLSGHPHVVTVLDTGTTASGHPYLAMDLYDGGSMKERLKRSGPLSAAETAMVGAKIAEALAAAHALGVLHRDVTPNNILVSRFGEPALADFGVSCLLDSGSSASVLDVFSPQHAAPELMTRGVPSESSDIYALGSTLYQLLTGQPPFGGEGRDVRSIMWRAMSEPPPRPECPDSPGLADAIVRAMAKEPDDRFPAAAEFAQTLRALIPEGTPTTLPMPVPVPESSRSASGGSIADAATDVLIATGDPGADAEPGIDPDSTSGGRLRGSDETMVRPDRADPVGSVAARGRNTDSRRGRKALVLVVALGLLGAAAWTVMESQGNSASARDDASAQRASDTPTASGKPTHTSARPSASATHTPTHSASTTSPAHVTSPSGSPSSVTTSAQATSGSTGSLLGLTATYYRFSNVRTGECLTQPAAQSACSASQSEGWENTLPLTGILEAPAGEFEMVNESNGLCLTAGSGSSVSTQTCDGGSTQLWTKVLGSNSSFEFHNAGDGQCLQTSGSAVTDESCSTSNQSDLWNEDGTV